MMRSSGGAAVVVDAHPWHPTIVFFQHEATRATLAMERATGDVVGRFPDVMPVAAVLELLINAVDEWQRAHDVAPCICGAYDHPNGACLDAPPADVYDHPHLCIVCGDLAGCYAPCGTRKEYVCGKCEPGEEDDITY